MENEEYEVSVMKKEKNNSWKWPKFADQIWYKKDRVLHKIAIPLLSYNGTFIIDCV